MTSDYAFRIDPNFCLQAHTEIGTAAERIRGLLAEIDDDSQRLLTGWEGEARGAFQRRHHQWTEDAHTILERLRRINAGLETAVHIYRRADQRGVDLIGGA